MPRLLTRLAFAGLLATPAPAANAETADIVSLAEAIDLRSFPNSTGPRRDEALRTLRDHGFTEIEVEDGVARFFEPDRSWVFAVSLIETMGKLVTLCIVDQALNSGSYFTATAIVFARAADGRLVATDAEPTENDCHI